MFRQYVVLTIFWVYALGESLSAQVPAKADFEREEAEADPGVPRIVWDGPRVVHVYGYHVLLNGFRFGGHYSKPGGVVKPLTRPNADYDYDSHIAGVSFPSLLPGDLEMWVALFAVAEQKSATATLRFVPYLRIRDYNAGSGVATFHTNIGRLTPNYFAGADALVVKEHGVLSYTLVHITANTADSVTLAGAPLALAANDYVLPAPGAHLAYKYLRTLKLEGDPHGVNPPEWRNFVFSEGRTYSYTGNPFGAITAVFPTGTQVDFSHFVSPLATGVLGSTQAYSRSGNQGSAYVYLDHDGSRHVISTEGQDRVSVPGGGVTGNFLAGFGVRQSLWASVNAADVVGLVTIMGWVED